VVTDRKTRYSIDSDDYVREVAPPPSPRRARVYSYFFSGSAGYYAALTPQIDSAAWLLALVFVGEVCDTGIVVRLQ
jgi:hypothetical protein